MRARQAIDSVDALNSDSVLGELDRILRSRRFAGAPRLSNFLSYVVKRAIADPNVELNEYVIGFEVFKRSSFDPRTDTIVRVQARRLRKRLAEYYAKDGYTDPILIALPTGSYRPEFRHAQVNLLTLRRLASLARPWLLISGLVALGAAIVAFSFGNVARRGDGRSMTPRSGRPVPALRSLPLTTYGGQEQEPDLSPDGLSVAFVWNGERRDNYDIYFKAIQGGRPVRLTEDPASECCPAWSPDGQLIAFIRPRQTGADLIVTPVSGGVERVLTKLSIKGHKICWSRDGRSVAVEEEGRLDEPRGIFWVSSETGRKRRVTLPPAEYVSDRWPALSPDGRTLAFARGSNDFAIYTVPLAPDGSASGEPRRLTRESFYLGGLDWAPDGRELVFGTFTEGTWWQLWKVGVGTHATEPVPVHLDGFQPSIEQRRTDSKVHMAYVAHSEDKNIFRVAGRATQGARVERIAASSRTDTAPQLTSDGEKIVFISGRSGSFEVWTANSDGSSLAQITSFAGVAVGSPQWSPDGRWIAFDAAPEGHADVYVVDAGGGLPRRLTTMRSNEGGPNWSRDGRWIYYMSDRGGRPEIWKTPSEGGDAVQVTNNGGHQAMESFNGKWLYYSKSMAGKGEPGIFRMPVEGGEEDRVVKEGVFGRWALSRSGLYLLRSAGPEHLPAIEWFRYETWEREILVTFPKEARFGIANSLTVSADDRWIVYAQYEHMEADLTLAENFQ